MAHGVESGWQGGVRAPLQGNRWEPWDAPLVQPPGEDTSLPTLSLPLHCDALHHSSACLTCCLWLSAEGACPRDVIPHGPPTQGQWGLGFGTHPKHWHIAHLPKVNG